MTLEEYLKCRESMTFTRRQVEYLLRKCGYRYKLIDTLVKPGKSTWKESGYESEEAAQKEIRDTNEGKIPYHFAYIKFYKVKNRKGPYALVAGKTNLGAPDFYFVLKGKSVRGKEKKLVIAEMGKDKAKAFLEEEHEGRKWYSHRVLVVWSKDQEELEKCDVEKEINLALSVEADIGGLFGLFYS